MQVDAAPDRVAQLRAQFETLVAQGPAAMAAEHGYVRSDPVTGAVLSEEDERTLHRLLLERVFAKRLRDFDVADQLRAQLKSVGVTIDDGQRTFRVRPPAPPPPTHHGYTRTDDGSVAVSAADQAALDGLLLQRVLAKRQRDFAQADALQKTLIDAGVHVNDHTLTYRVVSRQPAPPVSAAMGARPSALPPEHGLTRVDEDDGSAWAALSSEDQATVHSKLLQRLHAKLTRQFDIADALRAELSSVGVFIDDKARIFRFSRPRATPSVLPTSSGSANHR